MTKSRRPVAGRIRHLGFVIRASLFWLIHGCSPFYFAGIPMRGNDLPGLDFSGDVDRLWAVD